MMADPGVSAPSTPRQVVEEWMATRSEAPGALTAALSPIVDRAIDPLSDRVADQLRPLLEELSTLEVALAAATRTVAITLDFPADADPSYVMTVAEQLRSGPATDTGWWTAPDIEMLLSAIDALESQGSASITTRREFARRWGDRWTTLASDAVASVLEGFDALRHLSLDLPETTSRRSLEAIRGFLQRTQTMLEESAGVTAEVSAVFGSDVTALPLHGAIEALRVAKRLARMPQPFEAWADPMALGTARMTIAAIRDDVEAARAATEELGRDYNELVWRIVPEIARDDPRESLAKVRLSGRAPTDPEGELAKIEAAQTLRDVVAQMDAIGARALGPHWKRHLTDLDEVDDILDELESLHLALGPTVDPAHLKVLLSGRAWSDPAFVEPLRRLVEMISAWAEDAARHGLQNPTALTGAGLTAWVRDGADRIATWCRSFDAVPALREHTEVPLVAIKDAAEEARGLLSVGGAGAWAVPLLGPRINGDLDWNDLRERLRWVADARLVLHQGRPAPEAVARILAARAVPDPEPIRARLTAGRALIERIAEVIEGVSSTG